LGKLFAAVCNNELSNKMASNMKDQKMFVIRTFYTIGGFCVVVDRLYHREFSVRVASSRDTVYRTIKQSGETGLVCDKLANGRK
jgi:Fe2+ or Zn2+ uptake regulation protein